MNETVMPLKEECESEGIPTFPEFDLMSVVDNKVDYPPRRYDQPEDMEAVFDIIYLVSST